MPKGNGVAKKTSAIPKDIKDVSDATKRAASDSVEALRDAATQYVDYGRQRVLDLEQSVESRIQEQPLKALLIAAGIGFFLGAVLVRRR